MRARVCDGPPALFFRAPPHFLTHPPKPTQDCLAALHWCLADLYRVGDSFHFLHVARARSDRGDAFCAPDAHAACAALEQAQAAILDKFAAAVDAVGVSSFGGRFSCGKRERESGDVKKQTNKQKNATSYPHRLPTTSPSTTPPPTPTTPSRTPSAPARPRWARHWSSCPPTTAARSRARSASARSHVPSSTAAPSPWL